MSKEGREGEDSIFFETSQKAYEEVVILVPFFGAKPRQLQRHVGFLNESGFDVLLVKLDFRIDVAVVPLSSQMHFGYKHLWADHIEKVLNSVSRPKIVYAFSNPSASAIEAIARRRGVNISALICDSGPTKYVFKSIWRLGSKAQGLPYLPLTLVRSVMGSVLISPNFSKELDDDLSQLPEDLPILSIRGWKDWVIPPSHIDDVFEPHPRLTWQKLSLPDAEHLTGLRDYPEEYKPGVLRFLNGHGTKIP